MQAQTWSREAKGETESSCTIGGVRVGTTESEDVAATEEAAEEATDAEMATAEMTTEGAACSRGRDSK